MTPQEFARQISSYIDLNTIRQLLTSYEEDKSQVLEKSIYFLGSNVLNEPYDWDLLPLIEDFFKNFSLAEESLDLLLKIEPENSFSQEAIDWLKTYRFSGELRGKYDLNFDTSALPFEPIISVIAESGIIEILKIPLNFLVNAIEVFSNSWSIIKSVGARAFLEPSSPSELFNYIEKRVAMKYEYLEKNRPGEFAGSSVINGYRYICITSEVPIDSLLLKLSNETSIFQASSTLN
jgi:hypothetical protein